MRRRQFITLIGGAAAWPLAVRAQQPARKVPLIGYLGVASAADGARGAEAFETGLRDLGYVPGKSLVVEYRWADGRYEQLDVLATELVRVPVDVLFAPTTAAALAARKATTTIPIVFSNAYAPIEAGLVESLARPGGNITGLTYYVSYEIIGKQLDLLREIRPGLSKVAVLWNPSNPAIQRILEGQKAAGLLGIQLRIIEARGPDDFEGAFRAMAADRADALLVLPDPMLSEHRAALGALALKNGLPTMSGSREDLSVGVLMAYGANRLDLTRRAAGYVDKILKGARPADLPVEQPTKFELVVNLATAKGIGLTIPEAFLLRADEVIE
jgi:putative tryptophan/tyrosine transport system substrate-binding protein